MAESKPAYLIDGAGQVGEYDANDAEGMLGAGFTPAGKSQIEDFLKEKAFHEKYGTLGQQAATFGEGAAQALTFGLSDYAERALGVNPEDIAAREKENPGSHLAGTITGVAVPLVLSGGASAAAEGAEAGGGLLRGAASLSAPSLIARAGEAGAEGLSGLIGEGGASLASRIAKQAAAKGLGSAIEGAAYGLGQVVHESALGDPNLTASHAIEEIGLSALLGGGIGAGTGVLGKLVGEAAEGKVGAKLDEWMHRFEGNRNLSAAAGGANIQALVKREAQKIGLEGVNQLGREGGELGLVGAFSTPGETLSRAQELMETSGQAMGDMLKAADATEGNAAPSAAKVLSRARNEILKPLEGSITNAPEAQQFGALLDRASDLLGGGDPEAKLTFEQMHGLRREISQKIYGLQGNGTVSTEFKDALHDFRNILSDEINKGLDATDGFDSDAWKALNRKFQVASTFEKFAEKGLTAARGNNVLPLTTIMSTLAGHVTGGPLGGLGMGALAYGAKRFGSGILGAGARAARELIDEGAAEGLASRTAEAISEAREVASESGAATRAGMLWNRLGETLERPVVAPGQDLARDLAKESLAEHGPEGTPVETVAALSHLERANQRVSNRVDNEASALLRAAPRVARGEVAAGISSALAKSPQEALVAHTKQAERIQQLAQNPDMLQQHLERVASDLHEHAPDTAQALQVALARCINVLNQSLPPKPPQGPLEEAPKPTPDQVAQFQRCFEAVSNPTMLLRWAQAGLLTPDVVAVARAAHPQQFSAIQSALVSKLGSHKGSKAIPYTQRQMVGLLLGRDVDGTRTPAMLQATRAVFAPPMAQQHPGSKPTRAGLEKLSMPNRMLTASQASSRRGND